MLNNVIIFGKIDDIEEKQSQHKKSEYNKFSLTNTWYNLRRNLISSNCIMIERGLMPPYQKCFGGCIVEDAVACIQDMRTNASGNVDPSCQLNVINEVPDKDCCPRRIGPNPLNNIMIGRLHSAYPEALECLNRVGCGGSQEYQNIEAECLKACPADDELYQYPDGTPLCAPYFVPEEEEVADYSLIYIGIGIVLGLPILIVIISAVFTQK